MSTIVSGELLQSLCEVSFYKKLDSIKIDQLKSMNQNVLSIDEVSVTDISKYKTIFIYVDFIHEFMDKFANYLAKETVIMTHNGDVNISNEYVKYLDNPKIKKWYCQNRAIHHKKLFSIPIGIANSQWNHGNQERLINSKIHSQNKEYLVYKNFDTGTNESERGICNSITGKNGIPMSKKIDIDTYLTYIAKSKFVISPPGNGLDCHRIWESLYLKTIPIVLKHECFSQFKHLPILFVERWEDITIPFLREKALEEKDWDIKELTLDFWRKEILI